MVEADETNAVAAKSPNKFVAKSPVAEKCIEWFNKRVVQGLSIQPSTFERLLSEPFSDVTSLGDATGLGAIETTKTILENENVDGENKTDDKGTVKPAICNGEVLAHFISERAPQDATLVFFLVGPEQEPKLTMTLLGSLPAAAMGVRKIYFIKATPEQITNPSSSTQIEYGILTGQPLADLSDVIREVYGSLFKVRGVSAAKSEDSPTQRIISMHDAKATETKHTVISEAMLSELRSSVQKFESQIEHAVQQVNGEVQLYIPDIAIVNVESQADDYEVVSQLEAALEGWSKAVAQVVEQEGRKSPQRAGPLAEIEFWRQRNVALSALYEQISMPNVQAMLQLLEIAEANTLPTFRYHFSELTKLYVEAKDNVKFLTTLERHFKNISGGNLASILDTLQSMMNAIRMVWIISRHYNTDERMVPLMERIAAEIAAKVAMAIDIREILHENSDTALNTINEAISVLTTWYQTYISVREKIEASGTDHRWEFDRKRLFEQTNYMAKICQNLHEVAVVLDQFHKFLGPKLKAVTGDSKGIDEVSQRVEALIGPLESVPFDIFDRRYKSSWDAVIAQFREKVNEIEEMTSKFIDTRFKTLRSAEGAFDLLQNFQNIQSRESINKQMMEKFDDILRQYSKEMERIRQVFITNKENPPVFKNYPPVAGAISWAQLLYYRAKRPVMRFRTMESLFQDSGTWQDVMANYISLATDITEYCKHLFQGWQEKAQGTSLLLQQPIFGPPLLEQVGTQPNQLTTLQMPPPPYYVNFSPDLVRLVRETKYLDRMGYKVPEAALNVALQEDKYHGYVQALKQFLDQYTEVVDALTPGEKDLLKDRLEGLKQVLMSGFDPLNWCSLHIPTFIDRCTKAIAEFQSMVNQVHKSAVMIEEVVTCIETTKLIQEEDFVNNEFIEVSELYEKIDKLRVSRLEELVRKYRSVGPLLIKVEEILAHSNTGKSPVLKNYYNYWERKMFNAITQMVVVALATFQVVLNIDEPEGDEDETSHSIKRQRFPPLCRVRASLNGSDIVVTPALTDVYKYMNKTIRNIVESSRYFVRWMDCSCIECDPIIIREDEEPVVYSFFNDLPRSPHITQLLLGMNQSFSQVFSKIHSCLDSWLQYNREHKLWDSKKKEQLLKLAAKNTSCVFFDTKLGVYDRLSRITDEEQVEIDVDFLHLDCFPVAVAVGNCAMEWKVDYGNILLEQASQELNKVLDEISAFRQDVEKDPKVIDDLKYVLKIVSDIQERNMDQELCIANIMEQFRTLKQYGIDCGSAAEQAATLDTTWHQLLVDSKTKALRLNRVKEQFSHVTQTEASDFEIEAKALKVEFTRTGPGSAGVELDQGVELVSEYQARLAAMTRQREEIVNAQKLFDLPISSYPELNQVSAGLESLKTVYDLYTKLKDFEASMSSMLWTELDIHALVKGADELEKQTRKFPKDLKALATFQSVEEAIVRFKESIPLIQSLKNDAVKPRHWEQLMGVTGVKFDMNPSSFTLGALFEMQLSRFESDIAEIVNEGMQEAKIEKALKDIEEKWKNTSLTLAKYKKGDVDKGFILRSADEIKLELEDNMLNLQTMSGSRFVLSFSDVVRKWEKQLSHVGETLDIWFKVQSKWMYLESIFIGAEDIRMQLPEEAKRFDTVDKAWKGVIASTAKNPNVIDACHAENRIETLQALSERLDVCQKSLSDYLDTKRNSFPRFFFISDDELLSVLGSSDPTGIQVHMLKLFDNTKLLDFSRGAKTVVGMASSEDEKFAFANPAPVDGPVETWMTGVAAEMRSTLKSISKIGVFEYANMDRVEWVDKFLGMVGLLGTQIWWTWEVEDVFRAVRKGNKHAMKQFEEKLTSQLNDLVNVVRQQISKHLRKKVNTLLIIDVHARDIVDSFVRDSILDEREFAWESQLRFYWDRNEDDVVIKQCTGSFGYGYEFMGLNGRLVITPLTDRCYMTITQAHTFNLGTAPSGPAGTGKTETVKDLAKGMTLPCFVINCGEGLDYKAMGSIFSGLAQIGAWGCFDEFNRINIEVLSVVSAQLQAIQGGLKAKLPTVDIGMGIDISLNPKIGIFVTMNPGYAGRTELPDNLKALFRPVTMIVPDLLQICEIMLFSEGFGMARTLAKKMTTLYSLAKGQLSKQYHYDFGLRALKSVLVMAGGLKRQYENMSEDLVLMRALRDSNMPKFVFDDVPLFRGLITDLFPGLDCPRVAFEALKQAVEATLENDRFRPSDDEVFNLQVDKVIQMYETMLTRHTCMIVGPTGGGKSVVLQTLQKAQNKALDLATKIFTLNPKAQSLPELYGELDPATRDWTDGVLSNLFRDMNSPLPAGKENEVRWLIFDGDVDALWIENMNSVMDDNRLLTLPNGERIRLQPYCKLVMETFDLQYASPATISRCGMVYVDPKNLGYRPYYERWVNARYEVNNHEQERDTLLDLFERFVPKCITYVLEGMIGEEVVEKPVQTIPISDLSMVKQLCNLIEGMLAMRVAKLTGDTAGGAGAVELGEVDSGDLEGFFSFALTWSIGGALVQQSRPGFEEVLKSCSTSPLPDNLYSSFYDYENRRWQEWKTQVPDYVEPAPFEFAHIIVPTMENVLYTHLLHVIGTVEKPVLFVGEPGTAKTVTIINYLNSLDSETKLNLMINFSSRTTSLDVQNNIVDNVDKRTGRIYGPPAGKQLLVFIDDMNMPIVDTYGTQQPIALLHFLVGKSSMYDRGKELDLRIYKDLLFLAAMGPPGGGRNPVDPRFVSLFNVFNLTPPSDTVLIHIYSSILSTRYKDRFDESVIEAGKKLPQATLVLYQGLLQSLPPTPSKFHYVFNLRDLSRIFEGLCLATPDFFSSTGSLVRLWRNEAARVLFDRLVSEEDVATVTSLFEETARANFPGEVDQVMQDPIIFGDFKEAANRIAEGAEDPQLYQEIENYDEVRTIFDSVLESYNIDNKPMTLVLFEMALEHLSRVYRIIRIPRGHALLIGVGGSGKQSLTKLATFAAGYETFTISLSRGYGETEFREDLKEYYKKLVNGSVVFLLTDAHVVEEGFLELINNMLTTGMVPALFPDDEKDQVCNSVRAEVKAAGIFDTKDNLWNFFVQKCRKNMHIVLAMSPSGDTLRIRCRNFPGLVSGCVIDWFFPWPTEALRNVAHYFLQEESLSDNHRSAIVDHMVLVHQSVINSSSEFYVELRRHNYVTPKNYLDFIANYRKQMKENKREFEESVDRLSGGLTKLKEAEVSVDQLSKELETKKVVVDAKTQDCQVMIADIDAKQIVATEKQEAAQTKQQELEVASEIITTEKAKADEALEEALPMLDQAAQALENLNKNDITEIKAFSTPPPAVMSVCMCVAHLKPTGTEDDTSGWKGAKVMIGQQGFLQSLKTFNKDGIKEKQIRKVKVYFRDPDFNMEVMSKVSKAGAGLLQWVIAITKYHEVAKNVEPLRLKVRDLEKQKESSQIELAEIMKTLNELNAQLEELNKNFTKANDELTALRSEAQLMEKRLTAASKLIAGLGSEKVRWSKDIEQLKNKTEQLVGDCVLGASFLSYLGVFTFKYRSDLLEETWYPDLISKEVPLSDSFSVERLLTNDVETQQWSGDGLPSDNHSIQNGIITTNASRFPLCIDPQQQAVRWIKKKESVNNLTIKTFNDPDFMKHLELAIQFGNPFLFENLDEELDPMVDPVLEKNTFMQGGQQMIMLGDKTVDWDPSFRLYLTTKLANPHYTPEVMGKTMIVNYSVTVQGLADQLLNVVVGHERKDIEERFAAIVSQMSENTQALAALEDSLLQTLASSQGNILDNVELIQTLDESKTKAVDIQSQIETATFTKDEIQTARKQYTPVAKRGSILFFAMSGLSGIMKMYETSLASFLTVFQKSLDDAKKDVILENRLENMVEEATRQIYDYTCTGIFEKHKLMFSMQMTVMIMEGDDELNRKELDLFLKGETALSSDGKAKPFNWISDSGWRDLCKLATLDESLNGLITEVEENEAVWREWYELETPETEDLPMGYSKKMTSFQRLLLCRCFRADRVYNAVKLFIMGHPRLGEKYVQPPVLDFRRIYNQSTSHTPMVFVLSPGADPASDIILLGEELGFSGNHFKTVSLGQGQGPVALQLLEIGAAKGYWVLLQNCHLLVSWLRQLESTIETMTKVHENFRLWLTTDPTDKFPMGILQRSLKVVTEPPDGLKLNIRSTFSKIDEAALEDCDHPAYRPLVFVLTYLHAVVQERRKYGKIGWNVNYDFNESDFKVSKRLLGLYLNKAVENNDEMIPWGSLKYLIGDAMYGGRVSDNFDRRVLVTYVNEYMGDFLFDDCQRFYFSQAGFDYTLPEPGSADDYKHHVEKLPLNCGPAVFGLHPNAEIGYLTNATRDLWRNLLELQPRTSSSGSGLSREDVITNTADDIQKKIAEPFDVLVVRKRLGVPSPTQIVLLQEIDRWNALVETMATSLVDLKRALKGEIGTSEALDNLANSLYNGFLPDLWRKLAPDTQKPLGSWMIHFNRRYAQYNSWIENGEPAVVWLSGLHIPESYLTALVQATCRLKHWPLDKSTLYTMVTKITSSEGVEKLEYGCYVEGLFLEGAAWDLERSCLTRQPPKVLVQELPILQVIPIEASKLKLQGTLRTPVYVTQARRNAMGVGLVFEADLFTDEHDSHWVLQGVSLCLSIDN